MNEKTSIFNDLFVLEIARNHWGRVERGKEIIKQYAEVIHKNDVRASIKLQVFDTDRFVHKDHWLSEEQLKDGENTDAPGTHSRYIKKMIATKLQPEDYQQLADAIKAEGLVLMATPYDEQSVDLCEEIGVEMMKIASSDSGCITLLERVIKTGLPLSISTGAITMDHINRIVKMADEADIPLLINQCVSNYPSEDADLQLNQIHFLKKEFPQAAIGLSAHDYIDITRSHIIAVAKGAVSYERHADIQADDIPVSKYCIIPEQADEWFRAHHVAKAMCGGAPDTVREMTDIEAGFLKSVNRGMYALRDLPADYEFDYNTLGTDYYLAIPLQEGQISSRELDSGFKLKKEIKADQPINHEDVVF